MFFYEDAPERNSVRITQHNHEGNPYANGEFGQELDFFWPGTEIKLEDNVRSNATQGGENNGHFSPHPAAFHHPCKNFAFPPPPPPNRKRIGPRRKFESSFYVYFSLSYGGSIHVMVII